MIFRTTYIIMGIFESIMRSIVVYVFKLKLAHAAEFVDGF